jgi:hypothetical protein
VWGLLPTSGGGALANKCKMMLEFLQKAKSFLQIANVLLGISPAGEIPKRTFAIFESRRKLEIYNFF